MYCILHFYLFQDNYDEVATQECSVAEEKERLLQQYNQNSWQDLLAAYPPMMNLYERENNFDCVQTNDEGINICFDFF